MPMPRGSRTFAARYGGTCAACDDAIEVDDEVRYDADDQLVHDECGTARSVPRRQPISPPRTCSTCGLQHVGEC